MQLCRPAPAQAAQPQEPATTGSNVQGCVQLCLHVEVGASGDNLNHVRDQPWVR